MAVIAVYDWQSAVIVLIALPLIPIFMVLIGLTTADRSAAALRAMATLQSRLLDLVAGLPTLRALRRVGGSATRIAELGAAHRRSTMATLRIAFLSSLVLELLATLGVALVAVSVGLRLVYGNVTLTAGLTALLLAPEVFWPLRRVGMAFHAAQDGKAAADNAFRLLDALPRPADGTQTVAAAGATIDITALNAAVEPGRVTVIAGPNGAGKTTLLQAILGLNRADVTGRIRVDGVDVADLNLRAWWAAGGLAGAAADSPPRHGAAESRTVRPAGLTSKRPAAPHVSTRYWPSCRTVCIRCWAAGGVGLSLGQRQRLGLARALGSAAPVLLLDEPTAHLDAATECRVLHAITARAAAGATVIVVGHREPVLAIGDQIVHLGSLVHV